MRKYFFKITKGLIIWSFLKIKFGNNLCFFMITLAIMKAPWYNYCEEKCRDRYRIAGVVNYLSDGIAMVIVSLI